MGQSHTLNNWNFTSFTYVSVGNQKRMSSEWSKAVIKHISKRRDKSNCDNYRNISLLIPVYKMHSKIIIQTINKEVEIILLQTYKS
jgi:hypothetical protein